jgi:galactose oxidase
MITSWASVGALYLALHAGATPPSASRGAWSDVVPLSTNPVSAALLPSGKVLMWSSNAHTTFEPDIGLKPSQTETSVFDPSTNQSALKFVTTATADMFCSGTAYLADGRILTNGGSSSPKTSIYDPATGSWSSAGVMNVARGYNADVLLPSGEILTLGGSWSGSPTTEKIGEVWSPVTGSWSPRPGIPARPVTGPDRADSPNVYRGDNHAWLFVSRGGRVFHAGPSAEMHWIDTSGAGSISDAGPRGDDAYSVNGNAALYDIGKIFKTGGAPAYSGELATAATYIINTDDGSVTKTVPMNYPRAYANAVVLPTGQVFVVGGQKLPVPFNDDNSVLTPELWDPANRTFTSLAPMQTPRNYHSTALLLTDGRVFAGGGGQCDCAANHPDAEIFSPPYLFNDDGTPADRPMIISAPDASALGSTVSVSTDIPVAAFAMLRLSSVTHTVDNDQRRIPLAISSVSGETYSLRIPADSGVAPPGYYMLFAMNARGTPSTAAILNLVLQ